MYKPGPDRNTDVGSTTTDKRTLHCLSVFIWGSVREWDYRIHVIFDEKITLDPPIKEVFLASNFYLKGHNNKKIFI